MGISSDNEWLKQIAGFGGKPLEKVMTLAGGTTNDPGDYDGTGNPARLFTVTGTVAVRLFAVCETDLAGASATLEVGVAGATAALIAQATATDIDNGDIWHDASPDAGVELTSIATEKIVKGNIIQTAATANITAGKLRYLLWWKPLSKNGNVSVA